MEVYYSYGSGGLDVDEMLWSLQAEISSQQLNELITATGE